MVGTVTFIDETMNCAWSHANAFMRTF